MLLQITGRSTSRLVGVLCVKHPGQVTFRGQVGQTKCMVTNEPATQHAPINGTADVAKRLGISPRTVRRLAQSRVINHCRVGGQVRFTDQDVTEYLKRTRVSATD